MRRKLFAIRPAVTMRGRKFKGLRGWAGKPLHPPLTDLPVAAYVLAGVFDLVSFLAGADNEIARDAYVAGTWTIIGGGIVSLGAALTGFWDWLRSTPKHTQAWRTANWHMAVMVTVTLIVVADIALRLADYSVPNAPGGVTILSVLAGALVAYGAIYGGALVYDYGFNVETSGDHPVWHESERDLLPGQKTFPA
ncbi:MAG: DUF2231 domain-containing protein [Actinomycetota bacterium]|nr:DUF2231 domain-containing protein [Actinomycetota bacterium]